MKLILIVVLVLLSASSARAQDRGATAFFLAGAAADDITTWRNMRAGHPEESPLYFYGRDQPKVVLLSLVITDAVTLWLAHHYAPRHPKLAKFALYSLGTMRAGYGVYNLHWEVTH